MTSFMVSPLEYRCTYIVGFFSASNSELMNKRQASYKYVLKRKNHDKILQHHDDALCGKSTLVVGSL